MGYWEDSIVARFEETVVQYPHNLAIKTLTHELTYNELNRMANQVAHEILALRGEGEEPIAILMDNDAPTIAALFGVLKAGKAYILLDATFPQNRLAYLIEDTQTQLLITNELYYAAGLEIASTNTTLLKIEEISSDFSSENPNIIISPDTVAMIIYTSGSTGLPKGVYTNHRNLLHSVYVVKQNFKIISADRFACIRTFCNNGSLKDIFCSLLTGASIYPLHPKEHGFRRLISWIDEHQLTIFISVATPFRQLLYSVCDEGVPTGISQSVPESTPLSSIRLVWIGGEKIRTHDIELFQMCMAAHCLFRMGFGSTETMSATYLQLDKETANRMLIDKAMLTLGYPVDDSEILIFDQDHQPLPAGQVGEIAVRSAYLALGYWRKLKITQERFLPDPDGGDQRIYLTGDTGYLCDDGALVILGRNDDQIKIRGHRIEIAEIEQTLLTHSSVKQAAVIARKTHSNETQLIAYIVLSKERQTRLSPATEFYQCAAKNLPDYMRPAAFVIMETLPMTLHGKLDYQALPPPDLNRDIPGVSYMAPYTQLEQQLADIWSDLLNIDAIGLHDNFFELGGHSLHTIQLMEQIEDQFAVTISLKSFFINPTIAKLSQLVQAQPETPDDSDIQTRFENEFLENLYDELVNAGSKDMGQYLIPHGRRWTTLHHLFQSIPRSILFQLVSRLMSRTSIQQKFFAQQVALTHQFLSTIDSAIDPAIDLENNEPVDRPERVSRQGILDKSLTYGLLHHYKVGRGLKKSHHVYQKIRGRERLETAKAEGKGVILINSHHNLYYWQPMSKLADYGIGGVQNHYMIPQDSSLSAKDQNLPGQLILTRQLDIARRLLQEGKVVQLLVDGRDGDSRGLTYNVHNRCWTFMTGFAELALRTNAVVLPVIYSLNQDGASMHTTNDEIMCSLGEPFDMGPETLSHDERVKTLMSQYVAILETTWATMPWLVPWYVMEQHLSYPLTEND
ncbi:MAG: AMP-binding protein [Chloroflexota bacterium]